MRSTWTLLLLLFSAMASTMRVTAQSSDVGGAVRVTVGGAEIYSDEPWTFAAGGSMRLYVYKRLSVEPEFMTARSPRFTQLTFVPNVALDLADPGAKVTPYVIGGLGYFHELEMINHTRGELAWNGGIGVRVRVEGRLVVARSAGWATFPGLRSASAMCSEVRQTCKPGA